MTVEEFRTAVTTWTRAEQLSVLRAAGFTCYQMTDTELVDALVELRRRNAEVGG